MPKGADALGDRMKDYERRETTRRFLPMLPVYARIDGRSFSSFTREMKRPYDPDMMAIMVDTTKGLVDATQARIGFTQSDEISLAWLTETYENSIFFEGKVMKMASVLAGLATAYFTHNLGKYGLGTWQDKLPHFDCRVIQLPSRVEAANMFLWRELDATKNAVSMAARAVYPHKAIDGKSNSEKQEMLFAKGINFNDYPASFKRGTFVRKVSVERPFTVEEMARIPEVHRPDASSAITRFEIRELDMPKFSTVLNRSEVIFDGAEPSVAANLAGTGSMGPETSSG